MSETIPCTACGHAFAKGDRFCPKCGTAASVGKDTSDGLDTRIEATNPTVCGSCSAPMGRDARFCPKCGTERMGEATVISHVSLRNAQAAHLSDSTTGEFEIIQQLGVGAMGSVYLARDVALSRNVAIKLIASNLLQDESMVSRFRLEAQTVASLRHPNIVNVHAVRQAEDLHYFVMDFIDGPPLRSIVKAHAPLEIAIVQALLYQIGSALDYAHHRGGGVIHRDIKPANIMVDLEGDAFVTDFGISKIAESQTGLTQTGATIGTPEYMSPEQCRGEELTGASDQYALGIVAYEMLTGKTPFSGSQYFIMVAHTSEEPESILKLRPDCPKHVADAVHRMLAKTPEQRWPDLESAMAAMGGKPLGRKDPIRKHITALAGSTAEVRAIDATAPLAPMAQRTSDTAPGADTSNTATSVSVMGVPARVEEGDSFTLSADVRGATQGSIPGLNVLWSSTDPAVAVVTGGRVQALKAGTAVITASVGDVANSVSVMVAEAAAAVVVVEPSTLRVASGERASVQARVQDRQGRDLERPIRWLTSDASVASVTRGEVVATGSGVAVITADSGGVTGTVEVIVQNNDARGPVHPRTDRKRPGYRHPAAIAALLLLVVAGGVFGAMSAGLIGGPGMGGTEGGAPGVVASVSLDAMPSTLAVGDSLQLSASARDADGNPVPGQDAVFTVDDDTRAMVRDGWLVASAAGPLTLSAAIGDVVQQAALTIAEDTQVASGDPGTTNGGPAAGGPSQAGGTPANGGAAQPPTAQAPASLNVRVGSRSMMSGDSQQALVDVLDERSRPMTAEAARVRWRSNDASVVTVDARTGTLSAVGPGGANVTAFLGDLRETVRITVAEARQPAQQPTRNTPALPTAIDLNVPSSIMDIGSSQTLSARLRGPGGADFSDQLSRLRLTSSDPAVVSINGRTLQAAGVGTAEISASLGTLTRSLPITVQAPVQSVAIQGGDRSMTAGERTTLAARVLGPGSLPLPGDVTWTSSASRVATVNARGVVSAVGPGTARITAESAGVSGQIDVVVSAAALPMPTAAEVQSLVDEYVALLTSGNEDRVRALHRSADEDLLDELLDLMDERGFAVTVDEIRPPIDRDGSIATAFRLKISIRGSFGGSRDSDHDFRALLTPSGGNWVLAAVVMTSE